MPRCVLRAQRAMSIKSTTLRIEDSLLLAAGSFKGENGKDHLHAGNKRFCHRLPDDTALRNFAPPLFAGLQADPCSCHLPCNSHRHYPGDNGIREDREALYLGEMNAGPAGVRPWHRHFLDER